MFVCAMINKWYTSYANQILCLFQTTGVHIRRILGCFHKLTCSVTYETYSSFPNANSHILFPFFSYQFNNHFEFSACTCKTWHPGIFQGRGWDPSLSSGDWGDYWQDSPIEGISFCFLRAFCITNSHFDSLSSRYYFPFSRPWRVSVAQ